MISGIRQIQRIAFGIAAAAEDALIVIQFIWSDAQAFIAPCDQIRRRNVVPVLQSVHCTVREPLIEQMPAIVEIGESVRISHQSGDCLHVVIAAPDGFPDLLMQFLQPAEIFHVQSDIALFPRPLSHSLFSFFSVVLRMISSVSIT